MTTMTTTTTTTTTSTHAAADRTVLLAGATGLVGGLALRRLVDSGAIDQVVVISRRPLPSTPDRTRVIVADFDRLDEVPPIPARAALCALGTTIKKAGSQAAFRAVDHDAVVAFGRWARRGGADCFVLVSSVGAAAGAGNFYLRVKGEAEQAVAALGYPRFVCLRPSMLLGARSEHRPAEAFARVLVPVLNPLMLGPARRYRAISADTVAAALIAAAENRRPGHAVWEHDQLQAAAGGAAPA